MVVSLGERPAITPGGVAVFMPVLIGSLPVNIAALVGCALCLRVKGSQPEAVSRHLIHSGCGCAEDFSATIAAGVHVSHVIRHHDYDVRPGGRHDVLMDDLLKAGTIG